MSPRPLLLLDVDGVVCPMAPRPDDDAEVAQDCPLDEGGYDGMWVPTAVPGLVERLAEADEMGWCTGWDHRAVPFLEPVLPGCGDWPVINWTRRTAEATALACDWKGPDVLAYVGRRPALWIDDNHPPGLDRWPGTRLRILGVRADLGLRDYHVDAAVELAATMGASR